MGLTIMKVQYSPPTTFEMITMSHQSDRHAFYRTTPRGKIHYGIINFGSVHTWADRCSIGKVGEVSDIIRLDTPSPDEFDEWVEKGLFCKKCLETILCYPVSVFHRRLSYIRTY